MKKFALVLMLICTTTLYAQNWKPTPWQAYLCQLKVEKDTICDARSIMLPKTYRIEKVDVKNFHCGPFYVPDPPPIFDQDPEYSWRSRYSFTEFFTDLLCTLIFGSNH